MGKLKELEESVCVKCVYVCTFRGLLLRCCSLSSSLMSHSITYAHLWNHITVNLIRNRYYPEKLWRNASSFSLQPNCFKAQLKK